MAARWRGRGREEAGGVGVGEADALVEHEGGVHELEAHILRAAANSQFGIGWVRGG